MGTPHTLLHLSRHSLEIKGHNGQYKEENGETSQ